MKIAKALLLLAVVASFLYGCSGGASTQDQPTDPNAKPQAATAPAKSSGGGMPPPSAAPDPTK